MTRKKCFCEKDQDGQCLSCKETLIRKSKAMADISSEFTEKISKLMAEMSKLQEELRSKLDGTAAIEEPGCENCVKKYSDIAVSKVIESGLGGFPYANAKIAVTAFFNGLKKRGIKAAHSKRSWEYLCKEMSWPVDPR